MTAEALQSGAIEIVKGLRGTYTVPGSSKQLPVNGDLSKLRLVDGFSAAAKTILRNTVDFEKNVWNSRNKTTDEVRYACTSS